MQVSFWCLCIKFFALWHFEHANKSVINYSCHNSPTTLLVSSARLVGDIHWDHKPKSGFSFISEYFVWKICFLVVFGPFHFFSLIFSEKWLFKGLFDSPQLSQSPASRLPDDFCLVSRAVIFLVDNLWSVFSGNLAVTWINLNRTAVTMPIFVNLKC